MKISAIVISYNDEKYLERCLMQLTKLDQLIIVDLGSSDKSPEIAKKYATHYLEREWEPIAEFILPDILDVVENNWILRADPDEIYPSELIKEVNELLEQDSDYSSVIIPFQYFFLEKPLKRTIWGGVRYFGNKFLNLEKVSLSKRVHGSIDFLEPIKNGKIEFSGSNAVSHYWVDNYKDLFEKHTRYLKLEGKSRYERGERFSIRKWVRVLCKSIYDTFVRRRGIIGSPTEIFLSCFYVWYMTTSFWALRQYSKSLERDC